MWESLRKKDYKGCYKAMLSHISFQSFFYAGFSTRSVFSSDQTVLDNVCWMPAVIRPYTRSRWTSLRVFPKRQTMTGRLIPIIFLLKSGQDTKWCSGYSNLCESVVYVCAFVCKDGFGRWEGLENLRNGIRVYKHNNNIIVNSKIINSKIIIINKNKQ